MQVGQAPRTPVSFHVVRASRAPILALALVDGQREAMRPFGIEHIVRDEVYPEAHLVAAELPLGTVVGGLRIEQRTAEHRLPLERAVELSAAALRKLERRSAEGLVELCGAWVSAHPAEPDLADRLVLLGLAVARALGMGHAVAFGGQHSLPLALRTGFHFEAGEPAFAYPDERYRSRIVWQRLPPSP